MLGKQLANSQDTEVDDAEIPRHELGEAEEDYQVHMAFRWYMRMNQHTSSPMC